MNLFRSEEHARKWSGFKPGTEAGIVALPVMARLFSAETFTKRLDPDYLSRIQEYRAALRIVWAEIMKNNPFWLREAP